MVRAFIYDKGSGLKETENTDEMIEVFAEQRKIMWVDIDRPSDEEARILDDGFHFHPLAVEDCLHDLQRPKLDNYEGYFFAVMHAVVAADKRVRVRAGEFDMFASQRYVVTFHKDELKFVNATMDVYRKNPALFEKGTDFIVYNLMDALVDEYFPLLDDIDERLNRIEGRIFKKPDQSVLNDLFKLRRGITRIRRMISPQRDIVNLMLRHDFEYMSDESRAYFMDVYDHLMRLFDMADLYHDMISTSMDAYLSSVSNSMNSVMKVLTVITTIMMPLSVITGIYGMNFEYMPELKWRYGYLWAWGLMAASVAAMVIYIRRKHWL
ncbi:magnesium/cobalt transporter CorA [Mahella australiensis]|uniref:Magnesium transport protein CorA n=1 Tax=Mahella australiensis (strain DSM 15567 / CIP 107919 / 50-1 BON) TaxID=697281 RepID=F3ZWK4_MAHA5|nr:magnesium/cobalt transporter CorA [Mahella australiensis]AEE95439.1 magnesium and cobalt transport protein CorA [Mahella australiensis 50-1 BON]